MQNYSVAERRTVKKSPGYGGIVFPYFNSMQLAAGSQSLREAQSAISRKSTNLQNPSRLHHLAYHFQEFALQMTAEHLIFLVVFGRKMIDLQQKIIFRS